jgi:hypothetical protein
VLRSVRISNTRVMQVIGPDDRTIYSVQKETEGRFTFIAHETGVFRFCFSNAMSTVTPKTVSFTLVLGEGSKREQVAKSGQCRTYSLPPSTGCALTCQLLTPRLQSAPGR